MKSVREFLNERSERYSDRYSALVGSRTVGEFLGLDTTNGLCSILELENAGHTEEWLAFYMAIDLSLGTNDLRDE